MVSFELSDEQKMVQETVASFATDHIEPIMRECDEEGAIPGEVIAKGWELGLLGGCIPEEYEGFGEEISALTNLIAMEELAWGDLSIAMYLMAPSMLAISVLDQGTEEQKKQLLPAFCAEEYKAASCAIVEPTYNFCASALKTTAVLDGEEYVINGTKCLVPLAEEAENLLVFAATSPGMGFSGADAFVVSSGAKGMKIGEREKNMGIKALATFPVTFKDCRVPAAARLGGSAGCDYLRILSRSRLGVSGLALGMSRKTLEHSIDYATQRIAFGEPIASRQAIAFMIAEMAIEIDSARLLAWEAAWRCDQDMGFEKEASLAKNYAAETVMTICDRGVQIMGGHGYVRDNPVEMWFRNARGFAAFEGFAMV